MSFWESAERADTAMSLAERLWGIAGFFGVRSWLQAGALLVLGTILTWISGVADHLPYSVGICVAVIGATYLLKGYSAFRIAWSIRGMKRISLPDIAKQCRAFYQEYANYMSTRAEGTPRWQGQSNQEEIRKAHGEMVAYGNQTALRALERFGPRAYAIAHQFAAIGIKPPNMFHFAHGDSGGAAVYIATIGELLEHGLLEEAKAFDPKTTWGASFR